MSEPCRLCPRNCGADRDVRRGYCGATNEIEVSKVMLHRWEEPPISGSDPNRGSGAIFFTHCPLGCVYCQNKKISRPSSEGKKYSPEELAEEMLKLEEAGAYNINMVSPTQYTDSIIEAVRIARERGLSLPIVWNTGGYESAETVRKLSGTVDVYLTDFKYSSPELSAKYSRADDYGEVAAAALKEMYAQTGKPRYDENGMLRRGVIVRHLVLPGCRADSIAVLRRIAEIVPAEGVLLSLMAQFTPSFLPDSGFRELRRKITTFEYRSVEKVAIQLGFDGFMQDRASATADFTPEF